MAEDDNETNAELDSPSQSELLSQRRKIKIAVARRIKIKNNGEKEKRRDHRKWRNFGVLEFFKLES